MYGAIKMMFFLIDFFVLYDFVEHNLSHHIQLRQKKVSFFDFVKLVFFILFLAMALYFSTLFQFCFKNVTGSGFPTLMEGQTKREKRERERTELKMLFEWTRCCVRSWRAVSGTQTAVYDQKQSWREREQQRDGGFAGQCV